MGTLPGYLDRGDIAIRRCRLPRLSGRNDGTLIFFSRLGGFVANIFPDISMSFFRSRTSSTSEANFQSIDFTPIAVQQPAIREFSLHVIWFILY
jgi:hypothetical protein